MPTRTAPLFTAAATGRIITLRLIDASGDLYAEALTVPVAATAAAVEAYAAAYAAASNASLYSIVDTVERAGDADPDNATAAYRGVVEAGINMLLKNITAGTAETPRLVAPVPAVLQGNQDIPLLSATEMSALILAILALRPLFSFQQAQYTARRERRNNPRIK